jgi:hypothetical protein
MQFTFKEIVATTGGRVPHLKCHPSRLLNVDTWLDENDFSTRNQLTADHWPWFQFFQTVRLQVYVSEGESDWRQQQTRVDRLTKYCFPSVQSIPGRKSIEQFILRQIKHKKVSSQNSFFSVPTLCLMRHCMYGAHVVNFVS